MDVDHKTLIELLFCLPVLMFDEGDIVDRTRFKLSLARLIPLL